MTFHISLIIICSPIPARTCLIKKQELRYYIDHFDSWETNFTHETKFSGQIGYFAFFFKASVY
jgi:hypothetical protein